MNATGYAEGRSGSAAREPELPDSDVPGPDAAEANVADPGVPDADLPDPDLCVVVPAHDEAANIEALYREVCAALDGLDLSYVLLFVDDGSTDETPAILERLHTESDRVRYLRLARNFGLQAALTAGLNHAPGRAVIVMDADLQDDPGALPAFVDAWRRGADVVYAIRSKRREWLLKRVLLKAFHRLMALLAEIPVPRDAGSFALYDRRVVDQINALPERNRYLPGLRAWVGFRQVGVPVARRRRHAGRPAQSAWGLVSLGLDGILAFSKAPLRLATLIGFVVTGLSGVALLVVVYWRFVERSFPSGVGLATIALALLFLGGVQLLVVGIMGEYLGRVYDEVKRRPHYVIGEAHGMDVRSGRQDPGRVAEESGADRTGAERIGAPAAAEAES